ncbi:MAG: HDOD domain-containing protein [candidate division KSB1 bacterium]|nr:HDOD domain-containing protein [candidate division KSB1 bacterium]
MREESREEKLRRYLAKVEYVPTIPTIVNQVLTELENPDANLNEVVEVLMADQVLTLRMIRLVNSAFWGLKHQVQSLKEAIVFMGLREVRNVVLSTWLVNAFVSKVARFRIEAFWEHSFGCGLVCQLLAKAVGYGQVDRAYLGGLLHDVGEVVLCQNFPEEFAQVVSLVNTQGYTYHAAEEEVMGINHTDFGQWLVEHWRLEQGLAEAASAHHDLSRAKEDPDLAALVHIADLFCRLKGLGYGHYECLQVYFLEDPAWRLLTSRHARLAELDLEKFSFDLEDRVEEVKAAVGTIYNNQPKRTPLTVESMRY